MWLGKEMFHSVRRTTNSVPGDDLDAIYTSTLKQGIRRRQTWPPTRNPRDGYLLVFIVEQNLVAGATKLSDNW